MSSLLHILFIRDSEAETQKVLQELTRSGYVPVYQRVDSAVSMQLALPQQPWDIIVCDYSLPNFNALEALQILQAASFNRPLIVLADLPEEEIAVTMMQAGAQDCLLQNSSKRLVAAITRELARPDRQTEPLQQLAAIVESAEDAIISTDLQGRVISWNCGAEKLYGYAFAEVGGQSLIRLVQPPVQPSFRSFSLSEFSVAPADSISVGIDCRQVTQQRKTGELIEVLLSVSLLKRNNQVTGFVVIARNISERQMMRQMKNEFISVVNHELRTPLTSLQGSIELLLTGELGNLSAQGLRMLQIAANNTDRLVQLTNTILDLEGISSGTISMLKRTCDIGQIVKQAIDKAQAQAIQRGVQLSVATDSIQVSLDPDRVEQVLYHLVTNAIQFSRPGGQVWLKVKLQAGKGATVDQPHVLIEVKDEGEGIPSNKLETIFEPFHQVDASDSRRQDGAGLGLAICRSIAQHHQGNLWVESTIGQGSTFYLALPVQRVAIPV